MAYNSVNSVPFQFIAQYWRLELVEFASCCLVRHHQEFIEGCLGLSLRWKEMSKTRVSNAGWSAYDCERWNEWNAACLHLRPYLPRRTPTLPQPDAPSLWDRTITSGRDHPRCAEGRAPPTLTSPYCWRHRPEWRHEDAGCCVIEEQEWRWLLMSPSLSTHTYRQPTDMLLMLLLLMMMITLIMTRKHSNSRNLRQRW